MLFYDWLKINRYSNGKVQAIKAIYQSIVDDPRPSFARARYDRMDFSGDSYIIKPESLMWAFHNCNQRDAANYLRLASFRNYADYLITGDDTLPINRVHIPTDILKQNSLIEITDNKIHFLLEK